MVERAGAAAPAAAPRGAARCTTWQRTSAVRPRGSVRLPTSAPDASSRCSSARSSASGSSRATTTSARSSRSPATFSLGEHAGALQAAPARGPARSSTTASSPPTPGCRARQPPDHTRLRGFIKKAFTPRRVAVLEPQIREIATRDARRASTTPRPFDLVSSLTYELPALVIFRLLGVPDEDVADVKRVGGQPRRAELRRPPIDEQVEHAHNLVRYWRYCLELVAVALRRPARRPAVRPRPHLPGRRPLARRSTRWRGLVYSQLTAGHETTSSPARRRPQGAARRSAGAGRSSAPTPSLVPTARRGDAAHRRRRCSPGSG